MPFPRAFYRAVVNLSRSQAKIEDSAAQSPDIDAADFQAVELSPARHDAEVIAPHFVEIDLGDLDFDRPEQALEALRRVVAEARAGEQLVLLRTESAKKAKPQRRRAKATAAVEAGL